LSLPRLERKIIKIKIYIFSLKYSISLPYQLVNIGDLDKSLVFVNKHKYTDILLQIHWKFYIYQ